LSGINQPETQPVFNKYGNENSEECTSEVQNKNQPARDDFYLLEEFDSAGCLGGHRVSCKVLVVG